MDSARLRCLRLLLVAFTAMGLSVASPASPVWSQATATIKLVVPFTPGGGADALARLLAEQVGRAQGVTVVVENRPGAGTAIATEAVARAAPDGSTVLLIANSFVINPHLKRLNYDPLGSFAPICLLTRSPNVIVVNSASPYRSLPDLVSASRAKPGEVTMAFQGPSTSQHIAFEKLKRAAQIDITPVPFTGAAPAVNALLGNHVSAAFVNYPSAVEQVRGGRLRAIAVASRARIDSMPHIPTIAEAGYANYEEDVWFGLVAPAKTSNDKIERLAAWLAAAMQAPEVKARLIHFELYPDVVCGRGFGEHLRQQHEGYGRTIREGNLKAE